MLLGEGDTYATFKDMVFLARILILSRFNFYILSTSIYRISQIAYAIRHHNIKEAWVNMEYSVAAPICQLYCKKNNVKLINFMHGEKVVTSRDSFLIFDEYIVWNEHYRNLASSLIVKTNFIILNPWVKLREQLIDSEVATSKN